MVTRDSFGKLLKTKRRLFGAMVYPEILTTVLQEAATVPAEPEPVSSVAAPKLSIIVPVYNEKMRLADNVTRIKTQVESAHLPYEIIIVDDGSTDTTRMEAHRLKSNPHVRIASHSRNMGISAAFKTGFDLSLGEYVMLCPVDVTSFSFLKDFLNLTPQYDIISTSKRHPKSIVIGYDKWRWLMSNSYHALVGLLFRAPECCTDTHYVKIYRRRLLEKIIPSCICEGAVGETELVLRASKAGAKLIDVPTTIIHDQSKSKTNCIVILRVIWELVRLYLSLLPQEYHRAQATS